MTFRRPNASLSRKFDLARGRVLKSWPSEISDENDWVHEFRLGITSPEDLVKALKPILRTVRLSLRERDVSSGPGEIKGYFLAILESIVVPARRT